VTDLDAVAAAALGCPLIAGLTGGRFGEVATYRPGRRILGVREVDGTVEVHIVARWGVSLPEVAGVVRTAVAPHAGGLPVAVFVDDIEVPAQPAAAALQEAPVAAP
jgi:uncharacterized alkaline shock family protein YloU